MLSRLRGELRYRLPVEYLTRLDVKHAHLRWRCPATLAAWAGSSLLEWLIVCLRANRPPWCLARKRLAAAPGLCCSCEGVLFSSEHILFACPFLEQERRRLQAVLSSSGVQVFDTVGVLSLGRSSGVSQGNSRRIVKALCRFLSEIYSLGAY